MHWNANLCDRSVIELRLLVVTNNGVPLLLRQMCMSPFPHGNRMVYRVVFGLGALLFWSFWGSPTLGSHPGRVTFVRITVALISVVLVYLTPQ